MLLSTPSLTDSDATILIGSTPSYSTPALNFTTSVITL